MTLPDTSDRRVGLVLLVLALLVLCWVLFDLWQRVTALADGSNVANVQAAPAAPPPPPKYQVNQIVNAHLFGVKKKAPPKKVAQPVQKKVEKTRLRLKLIGMVESSNEQIARALISLENGKPQSYGIGDPIDRTDAKVHSVDNGKVIIDRDGRLESLEMVRPSLADEQEKQDRRNGRSSNNNRLARRQAGSTSGFAASPAPQPAPAMPTPLPGPGPVDDLNGDGIPDDEFDPTTDPNIARPQPAQAVQRVRPVRRIQRAPNQAGQQPRRAPNPKFPF